MKCLRSILAGIFVLAIVASAHAATIRVPGNHATIQAAIDAAVNGDTVLVADGTYKGLGNKNLDLKGKAITVKSENGAGVTIIDCEGSGRGFYLHSGETVKSVVSGFTVTNGAPTGNQIQIGVNAQTGEKSIYVDVQKGSLRPGNDGDIAAEPGEVMGLGIPLKNNSAAAISSVTATLRTTDSRVAGLMPVYTGTKVTGWNTVSMAEAGIPASYGTILSKATKSLSFQYVKINESFKPLGDRIRFTVEVKSGETIVGTDEFYVRIGADIILERIDVDSDLRPGGEPEDIDLRFRNITTASVGDVRITITPGSRSVRIPDDRVELTEILSGRSRTVSFETTVDQAFAGYMNFRVEVATGSKLLNIKSFNHYLGMRTRYVTHWIAEDNNKNYVAEPGEEVYLQIERWNPTGKQGQDVQTLLETTDPAIASIAQNKGEYRDIAAGEVKEARREYEFTIANADAAVFTSDPNYAKMGHTVEFRLTTQEDGQVTGTETLPMRIGGMIRYLRPAGYEELMAAVSDSVSLGSVNNGNGMPEPGETIEINVTLINISIEDIDSVEAELDTSDKARFIVDYNSYGEIRKRGRMKSSKYLLKIDSDFAGSRITLELDIKGKVAGRKENLGKDVFTIPVQTIAPVIPAAATVASVVAAPVTSSSVPQIDGYGGGISCTGLSSPTIENNIIIRNTAINGGGGIFCGDRSSPRIVNNVIAGNLAVTYGGGVGCSNSSPAMVNNTMFGNSAGSGGGGIACQNSSFPTALNSILWGNNPSQIYLDSGSVIGITYSDIQSGWTGTGNINANPLFVSAGNNDYHLKDNSPCIGAGSVTQNVPAKDIEGKSRPNPSSTKPDMGAYESALPVPPLSIATVDPSSLDQGATDRDIAITGTGFLDGAVVSFSGSGITISSRTFVSSTKLTVKVTVSPIAPAIPRNVIVTNPDNRTVIAENTFQVNAVVAAIVSVETAKTVTKGSSFSAVISVADVADLAGFQLGISFNPTMLEAVKVEEGALLKSIGVTYWVQPKIANTAGTVTSIVCARTGPTTASGSGTLATVTFNAKGAGMASVKLMVQNVVLSDSRGRVIPVKRLDASIEVIEFPTWDVNKDRKVDVTDLVLVVQNFGQVITPPVDPNPDVNGDGIVNIADLILVGQHFGEVYGTTAPSVDLWSFDPAYLPVLVKACNIMERSPNSHDGFLSTKDLLHSLISSVKVTKNQVFQNYPNPFNPETWIPFQLSEGAKVDIRIYNSAGHLVKTLNLGHRDAGHYTSQANSARWDGTDEDGEKVASGVYFYILQAGSYSATYKMLMVK